MASRFFDENTAAGYRKFEFSFENASLRDKVIALGGGTGGLGAATAALLVLHGARVVAGYQGDTGRAQQPEASFTGLARRSRFLARSFYGRVQRRKRARAFQRPSSQAASATATPFSRRESAGRAMPSRPPENPNPSCSNHFSHSIARSPMLLPYP